MKEMETKYNHKVVEDGKYEFWLKGGFFESGDKSKEPFTIVIPPPNVTGKLHLGHAWDGSIQDMIIRYKRMQGFDALWVPGMDHAGIATQAKVDARLKEEGISRYDLGREKFLERAFEWKDEYANIIHKQWAALGLSLDYKKERFTLDEGLNKAVNHVFIKLYEKGYMYRGERIINWDSQAKTALSNMEVIHKDVEGAFYYFKYPFVDDKSNGVIIATTRPETMFADQAIMVHPDDPRFTDIIGKKVIIPTTNIEIPIIADKYVSIEEGTGCVKVTPAHDPNDFMVGKRHNLAMPLCMEEDGTMNSMAGKYEGLDRFECRKQLCIDLKETGEFLEKKPMIHSVGHSERTGVVVEPRLSKQWFVKMDTLADQVLSNDEYKFIPERFKGTLEHWLNNIEDWCVSRQLWWGHRIPAWYNENGDIKVQLTSPGSGWTQDEDVLDTWFSSALWPFSTLGWPDETADFKRYYPNDVLVTGYDIIFFWVARMLFEGIEFTGKAPFKNILIHGLIRDPEGRKMSKSLGNGIDPFDIKEKYGIDSLRYFLNTNSTPGQDLRYDETKVESSWNFLNKIWNISRYILMNIDENTTGEINVKSLSSSSKWILSKLNSVIAEVNNSFDKYEFKEAARVLNSFIWQDFANWYLEFSKVDLQSDDEALKESTRNVLLYVLTSAVKMLHPIVPFVTEEIYQKLPSKKEESISISAWPTVSDEFNFDTKDFDELLNMITALRNSRSSANRAPSFKLDISIVTKDNSIKKTLENNMPYLNKFLNPSKLLITEESLDVVDMVLNVLDRVTILVPSKQLIDTEEVLKKLNKELKSLEKELSRSKGMLKNEKFLSKAPESKIIEEKEKQETYKIRYEETKTAILELTK